MANESRERMASQVDERVTLEMGGQAAKDASEAVASFVAELQAAIDRDDADTYDRRFANDVMWGSPYGAAVHGYETLHAIHVRMHERPGASAPSHSRFEIERVLAPAPDVVIAQVRRVALGDSDESRAEGSERFSEMALYVLIRRRDGWWLAAGQNLVTDGYPSVRPQSATVRTDVPFNILESARGVAPYDAFGVLKGELGPRRVGSDGSVNDRALLFC